MMDESEGQTVYEDRERVQGMVLARVVGVMLWVALAQTLGAAWEFGEHRMVGLIVAISVVFALAAWGLRAATSGAAVYGGVVCWLVTVGTAQSGGMVLRSGLTPLLLLFLLTFAAGKMGRRRKIVVEEREERHGRQASQVIANLGMAGLAIPLGGLMAGLGLGGVLPVLMLAALAEATADTVSSEIGQAFGGTPWMVTTLRRVEPGTDGAVSVVGTGAGVVGAGVIAGCGGWAMHLTGGQMVVALVAGVLGLVFDSLLGATVERRGWLGNDLVNFSSTVFAVVVAGLMLVFF